MKCATHPDRDAIGICHSCGSGVCSQCHQRIGGIFYCLPCLDAGRYRPPQDTHIAAMGAPQVPLGFLTPLTRHLLIVGIFAMWVFITGFFLLFFQKTLVTNPYSMLLTNPFQTLAFILIALAISFTGIALFSYYRYYDSIVALSLTLFSLLSGWPLVLSEFLLTNPLVASQGSNPWDITLGPLYSLYLFSSISGYILWALTFIGWAVVFIRTRQYVPGQPLVIAASVLFLILANGIILFFIPFLITTTVAPYYLMYVYEGNTSLLLLIFAEPAAVLTAITFYRIRK